MAQNFDRFAVTNDQIGTAASEIFIEPVQSLVQAVLTTRPGARKGRVKDKYRYDRTRSERGLKRRVIRQSEVVAHAP